MKINKIEFENFRNFKEKGSVEFSTDGKVTIIYGDNGAGKTTFHQLFRWIIYGLSLAVCSLCLLSYFNLLSITHITPAMPTYRRNLILVLVVSIFLLMVLNLAISIRDISKRENGLPLQDQINDPNLRLWYTGNTVNLTQSSDKRSFSVLFSAIDPFTWGLPDGSL